MKRLSIPLTALIALTLMSCVRSKPPAARPVGAAPLSSLWQRPVDLRGGDLFYGPWGSKHAPIPDAVYTFVELKHSGVNPGMIVRDGEGRVWSVKQAPPGGLDREGSVEVAVSRLLSAVGYRQPPVYFLPAFTLKNHFGTHTEIGGRFRLKDTAMKELGPWSWQENPFVGTKPYQGLLVLMMMVNNTDLKNSNNTLYERRSGDLVERWYVVRDVGAALGDTNRFVPLKGDPDAFERPPFVLGVGNRHVEFAYSGWYRGLVRDRLTPQDVAWAADLLSELTDRQWRDAFRAGGFTTDEASRFIRKLRQKAAQGRGLAARGN